MTQSPERTYQPEIKKALDAFKALGDAWREVRAASRFPPAVQARLSGLQTVAHSTAAGADPIVVANRDKLGIGSFYDDRRLALQPIAHKSFMWEFERGALSGYVEAIRLDEYLTEAKKVLAPKRVAKLPTFSPLATNAPITSLSNQLSTPARFRRQRDIGKAVMERALIIDTILVVLANSFIDNTENQFDLSFSLAVGIAI